jgi:hypothetical protein
MCLRSVLAMPKHRTLSAGASGGGVRRARKSVRFTMMYAEYPQNKNKKMENADSGCGEP